MTPEIAARLQASDIQVAFQNQDYFMFARGNCVALAVTVVERFTSLGATGIMTEKGIAYLIWRDGQAWLSTHGNQTAAEPEQVEAIRRFSEDVKAALGLKEEI